MLVLPSGKREKGRGLDSVLSAVRPLGVLVRVIRGALRHRCLERPSYLSSRHTQATSRRSTMATKERAVLAGGCFWGMQDLIRKMPGVVSTRVGYSGGDVKNATYRNHGTHAEAVEIIFDPAVISYRDLLDFFF